MITDSNRRRVFVASRLRGNAGADARRATSGSPRTRAVLDPFAGRGADAPDRRAADAGVALGDARPFSPQAHAVPRAPAVRRAGRRPVHRVAGRPRARRPRAPPRRRPSPRRATCPYVDLCPYSDARGAVTAVDRRRPALRGAPGLEPPARWACGTCAALSVQHRRRAASRATRQRGRRAASASCGSRACAPPRRCARRSSPSAPWRAPTCAGASLTYLFERTTADDPWRPELGAGPRAGASAARPPGPRARSSPACWTRPPRGAMLADAWASVAPATPDRVLDRAAGTARRRGRSRARGASDAPGVRASRAFDGGSRARRGSRPRARGGRVAELAAAPAGDRPAAAPGGPARARAGSSTRVALSVDGRPGPALAVGRRGPRRAPRSGARARGSA